MKDLYNKLPEILKRHISWQAALSVVALLLFFIVIIIFKDILLALPCILFSAIMIVKSTFLLYNCVIGNYLEIKGVCSDVEVTTFRRRVKSLTIKAEEKILTIPIYFRLRGINVGDTITVYLSKKARLYYNNGIYTANDIYTLTVLKEAEK